VDIGVDTGMSSQPSSMSSCRVVARDDARVVLHKKISSAHSSESFSQFHEAEVTFVDQTLVIEAFLRDCGGHHLVLRPRGCGKSFTLSMIR
jgi:hypothetical protein